MNKEEGPEALQCFSSQLLWRLIPYSSGSEGRRRSQTPVLKSETSGELSATYSQSDSNVLNDKWSFLLLVCLAAQYQLAAFAPFSYISFIDTCWDCGHTWNNLQQFSQAGTRMRLNTQISDIMQLTQEETRLQLKLWLPEEFLGVQNKYI